MDANHPHEERRRAPSKFNNRLPCGRALLLAKVDHRHQPPTSPTIWVVTHGDGSFLQNMMLLYTIGRILLFHGIGKDLHPLRFVCLPSTKLFTRGLNGLSKFSVDSCCVLNVS